MSVLTTSLILASVSVDFLWALPQPLESLALVAGLWVFKCLEMLDLLLLLLAHLVPQKELFHCAFRILGYISACESIELVLLVRLSLCLGLGLAERLVLLEFPDMTLVGSC